MEVQRNTESQEEQSFRLYFPMYEKIAERVVEEFSLRELDRKILLGLHLYKNGVGLDEIQRKLGLRESLQRALRAFKNKSQEQRRKKVLEAFQITNAAYGKITGNQEYQSLDTITFPDTEYLEPVKKYEKPKRPPPRARQPRQPKLPVRNQYKHQAPRVIPTRIDHPNFTSLEVVSNPTPPPIIDTPLTAPRQGGYKK